MYVWDTAGQERYRQIARIYYNEVCGAFVCFDLTEQDSFDAVNFWLQDLNANAPKNIVKILVGLKLDLVQPLENMPEKRASDVILKRGVSSETATIFAQRNKMHYIELSSKTGHNVEQAFYKMAFEVHKLNTAAAASGSRSSRDGSEKRLESEAGTGTGMPNMM